ncbi:MAG: lipoyl(octanoyl) transferase [Ignavibacteria bacterium GWB2_35_6b]|nr:MAG: lipoyl(octanoyl) transferase [Ignavibacteria bacterium GWB2_35_6b]
MSRIFEYCDLGKIDYQEAWDLQKSIFDLRTKNEIEDILFLLEHPHTYTLGKVADKNNLVYNKQELEEKEITVFDIDRGGDITYHGPGQIVGYPIIDLKNWKQDTHLYLRNLEEVLVRTCADYGLSTGRKEKYTGVWVEERKICAIGIKVSRWITMHGFAFNVNTDLNLFNGIIPCGINDKEVTSLKKELKREFDLGEVKDNIIKHFKDIFGYDEYRIMNREQLLTHV